MYFSFVIIEWIIIQFKNLDNYNIHWICLFAAHDFFFLLQKIGKKKTLDIFFFYLLSHIF
jgi:hypothetical protein